MKKILLLLLCMFILSSCIIDNDTIDNTLQNTSDIVQEEIIIEEDIFDDSQLILTIDDYSDEYGAGINSNNFPDKYLRYYVREYYDLDSNNYLSSDEIVNTTDFNSSQDYDYFYKINDFKGLDIFTNLETICISNSEIIDSFDFSPYKKLEKVTLSGNNITDVDFSNNHNIDSIMLKDMLTDKLILHGCDDLIDIYINNGVNENNDPFILDVTDCYYFSDPTHYSYAYNTFSNFKEVVRPVKFIYNEEVVVYDTGVHDGGYHNYDEEGVQFRLGDSLVYFGQGTKEIVDDSKFYNFQDAIQYGLQSNSCFTIQSIIYDGTSIVGTNQDNIDFSLDKPTQSVIIVDNPLY